MLLFNLAHGSDPTPTPRETDFVKQGRGDFERIKACHVLSRHVAFDIKPEVFRHHSMKVEKSSARVQRQF